MLNTDRSVIPPTNAAVDQISFCADNTQSGITKGSRSIDPDRPRRLLRLAFVRETADKDEAEDKVARVIKWPTIRKVLGEGV